MLRDAPALQHAGVVLIRKTATRARRDGGSYTSFRLVESVRSGSQVSQRTLLHLGSGFAVPAERWPELVLLVESLRAGQACLLEPDPALLGEAERSAAALVVARLVHRWATAFQTDSLRVMLISSSDRPYVIRAPETGVNQNVLGGRGGPPNDSVVRKAG